MGDGLSEWLRGIETYNAEAAGSVVGEIVVMAYYWLKSQLPKK